MEPITVTRLTLLLLTFFAAIFATVWAIELYSLLKTGEVGKTWRVIVVATILFAVSEVFKFGELLGYLPQHHVNDYLELPFIIILATACYMQRKAFFMPKHYRSLLFSRFGDRNGGDRKPQTYDYEDDDFSLKELEKLESVDERE